MDGIMTNIPRKKEDALTQALLKAEKGFSYPEICKSLEIKETYFSSEEKQKIELIEKSFLLSKARNNFDNKKFNNTLWSKYYEVRFSNYYNNSLNSAKNKDQQNDEWTELETTLNG